MMHHGFFGGYMLLFGLFHLILLAGWLVLVIVALLQLKRSNLPPTAQALWAMIVLLIPYLGAIALWIVSPGLHETPGN
jgi:hypothetical protein